MIDWMIVNIVTRALLTLLMAGVLIHFGNRMNLAERVGCGLIGGGSFMTIPILYANYAYGTPFDGWATTLQTLGCISFTVGRVYRFYMHEIRNEQMRRAALDHFQRHPR